MKKDNYLTKIKINYKDYYYYNILKLKDDGYKGIEKFPFVIKVLVENLLRKMDDYTVKENDLKNILNWKKNCTQFIEIPYHPARVLMQDFTGIPAIVDLAAMRDMVKQNGQDSSVINPQVPTELIIDHSVQIDYYGTKNCLYKNVEMEYKKNSERYKLLKWAQKSFNNFKVVPPNSGICHQINLEFLSRTIITEKIDGKIVAYPDTLVGTDSHTTMINSIGVLGWGVGGIEAEAVMLGQPYYMSIPQVIGIKLTGKLKEGVTATDLVLTITELLRNYNVVEKLVEFYGPGTKNLSLTDRATVSNMSPEFGSTTTFFPIDEKTIEYFNLTNREKNAQIIESISKACGLFYAGDIEPEYSDTLKLDLDKVEPCVAGHVRPQDRITLKNLKQQYSKILDENHTGKTGKDEKFSLNIQGENVEIGNGSIVIAAITSCTNTSNPFLMLGAGLVAQNAVKKGLTVPPYVKTSLTPGSKTVTTYLESSGLMKSLEALNFFTSAYGCSTCIGNSGPLDSEIENIIDTQDLSVAAILSGNRNFEARIHQKIKGNFLASPMLVIIFAIAGRINIDFENEPIGWGKNLEPVYLKDIWPDSKKIESLISTHVKKNIYHDVYRVIFDGDKYWTDLPNSKSNTFPWNPTSTYIRNPPYFKDFNLKTIKPKNIKNARALLTLGDTVTTDHISPAGTIPSKYPAGKYLIEKNVKKKDFNSYGSRRGNDEVMTRGTFGNIRIKNRLIDKEGSFTVKLPEKKKMFIYEAAMLYKKENTPLIVLGGKEYGTGSSRDWAAKGSNLLGIKAVITESFERIHRSNLIGMGVLPLIFEKDDSYEKLGIVGDEKFFITGIDSIKPQKKLKVTAIKDNGEQTEFNVISKLYSMVEVDYFKHGGILPFVLRKLIQTNK